MSSNYSKLNAIFQRNKEVMCAAWLDIKANNEEIIYKKKYIDPQYEYYTAKQAFLSINDKQIFELVDDYELEQFNTINFFQKVQKVFTQVEWNEYIHLRNNAILKPTADGGHVYTLTLDASEDNFEKLNKFEDYKVRVDTLMTSIWEEPYQLIAKLCHSSDEL